MGINLKKFGLNELGLVLIGVGLALLLPTPLLFIIGGSWLGWKGLKRKSKPSQSDGRDAPHSKS